MSVYDMKSVNLPRLSGRALRAFAAALENPATRALLLGRLLRDGGITGLRQMRMSEMPLFYPLVPDTGRDEEVAAGALAETAAAAPADRPFATAGDYARAYREGTTTPEAVAEAVLHAIAAAERGPRPLRAFIAVHQDDVMSQARAATARIAAGEPLSLLDGVPVAVKDEVDMVPYSTTVGTTFLGQAPAVADGTVVARLRAAGALLIGKTNMHEIGINPTGHNPHYGHARNPYNLAHDTGGSSSGSAVAVAAGFCPVAVGADGGGSIRVPAALCGVVGLKATYGRISEHGAAPLCPSVAHLGPIGATVADVALAYAIMAGPDPQDPHTRHQPPVTLGGWQDGDLRGVKIGVFWPWFRHAAADIVAGCEAMIERFVAAGAGLREVEIPDLEAMRVAHAITILTEMAANMEQYPNHRGDFAPATRINLVMGRTFTGADYLQAQRVRRRAMATFSRIFTEVDLLLTPATAVTAPAIPADGIPDGISDLNTVTELMRFMIPGNLVGMPAISFPAAYDRGGLPIGMQVMGRHWEEHLLLRAARVAEEAVTRQRPSAYYPILEK